MFMLSSISSSAEFLPVNHTSIYENSDLKVFKYIKSLGAISNNWPNDLFRIFVDKTLELCWYLLLTLMD